MPQNTGSISDLPKPETRRELRLKRSQLSSALRRRHDHAIGQHLFRLVKSHDARSVACYWPFDGEPDTTPVYRRLMNEGCNLALPVISGGDDHTMQFHPWRLDTELVKNRYGIPEPVETEAIPLSGLDMLVMPLVGYDNSGNRLGMGAGYYDRCLESIRQLAAPLRVGIAYSIQKTGPLVTNKWDIPLHGIVNEHGWFTFVREQSQVNFQED
jgi:5-formyltetrahydrofolate cyclo-ligase